jgi:CubicO group peptidase (beta-lactamase class C family)
MSVAKSITSILVGMAVGDGAIASVDDPITRYVPELAGSGYRDVTIRQALQMRSGADWDERYDFERQTPMARLHHGAIVENRIRFVSAAQALGRKHAPGTVFNYSTVETAVLGWVVERATRKPLAQYMSERFWQPAGMQSPGFWLADGPPGTGNVVNGMGFNAVLRDYGRIGLMMLNGGRAGSTQLLPAAWVEDSTRPLQEPIAAGETRGYAWQWWTLTGSPAYLAVGLQGQFIFVDPATATVIVKLSYFPPGEQRADAEAEAFFRAASQWKPRRP